MDKNTKKSKRRKKQNIQDFEIEQDENFRKDILKAGKYRIEHRIGSRDPKETVLTEAEFIGRLKMLYDRMFEW